MSANRASRHADSGRPQIRNPMDAHRGLLWNCRRMRGADLLRNKNAAIMRFKQSLHAFQSETLIHSPHLTPQRASTRLETAEGDVVEPINTQNHQFTGFPAAKARIVHDYHAASSIMATSFQHRETGYQNLPSHLWYDLRSRGKMSCWLHADGET